MECILEITGDHCLVGGQNVQQQKIILVNPMLPWPERFGQEMEWVIPGKGLQHKKNLAQEVIKEDYVSCRVWGKSSLEEKQLEKDDTLSFLTLLVFQYSVGISNLVQIQPS